MNKKPKYNEKSRRLKMIENILKENVLKHLKKFKSINTKLVTIKGFKHHPTVYRKLHYNTQIFSNEFQNKKSPSII